MYYSQPGQLPQQAQPVNPFAQQVAGGIFPYINRIEVIGQVFPTQGSPQGAKWVNAQQPGQDGHAEITLKLRKAWSGRTPGVKQSKLRLVAYGQLGQTLMQQVRPGVIVRAIGEVSISNFQSKSGQNAGQWITSVNIQIREGKNGEIPFEVLGILPVVDEGKQFQHGQAPLPQPQPYGAPQPPPYPGNGYPGQAPEYPPPVPQYPANPGYPNPNPGFNPPAQPPYSAPPQGTYPGQPTPPPAAYGNNNGYPGSGPTPGYPAPPQQAPQYAPQPQPAAPGAPTGTFLPTTQGAFPGLPMGVPSNGNHFSSGAPFAAEDSPF